MSITLELSKDCAVKAIIEDLSSDGFRLRSRALLHPGQRVRMRLPRDTLDCKLLWVDGIVAGGVFEKSPELPIW